MRKVADVNFVNDERNKTLPSNFKKHTQKYYLYRQKQRIDEKKSTLPWKNA
jgi:hypothetical protein